MRKRIIYEPTLSDAALLILGGVSKIFIESFWPHPYYHTFCEHANKRSFRNAIDRLRSRDLIVGERQKGGRVAFSLTKRGQKLADRIFLKLKLAKAKKWDGKWRLLIFDIPERIRARRDFFRKELQDFGFYQLQKSVWAYPYPLPKDFFDLWSDFNLDNHLVAIESAKITEDENLRNFFSL
ncbi:MAG: hypothetical protein HYW15_02870 [Candidatus Giovannonibacteria bacterium]|nr:MAG: hypothetical protein HYW15_02870 [Candidatus Giovannonibacteria bacterium]